jgi:hypothetical protein
LGEIEVLQISFPKRTAKRKTHIIYAALYDCDDNDIMDIIMSEGRWLLERLSIQAKTVIVKIGFEKEAIRIGKIDLR